MYHFMNRRIALYGQEVLNLRKHAELVYELAERLELPQEAVPGAARLSVTAGKRVLVENHRGLLEYGPERIVVKTEAGKLVLSGSGLGIRAMDRRDLLIGGKLQCAEWE